MHRLDPCKERPGRAHVVKVWETIALGEVPATRPHGSSNGRVRVEEGSIMGTAAGKIIENVMKINENQ